MSKKLTKSQSILASGLKLCGIQKEIISGLLSMLTTEDEQWSIIQLIAEGFMNNTPPTENDIAQMVFEIYKSYGKI